MQCKNTKYSRDIILTTGVNCYAEGSCEIRLGNTIVLCTASVENKVPSFLKNKNKGWLSAEYGLLPRATGDRNFREASRGKQTGRTMEIQRLIGRALRACLNFSNLGEKTIYVDCDVIQADGGTRTAAITGGCVAVYLACQHLLNKGLVKKNPFEHFVAAISSGIVGGSIVVDLDYSLDSNADTDMNIVMLDNGNFIEIQGTAEQGSFSLSQLNSMLEKAKPLLGDLLLLQKEAVNG